MREAPGRPGASSYTLARVTLIALTGGTVIDGTGAGPRAATVVIDGGLTALTTLIPFLPGVPTPRSGSGEAHGETSGSNACV